MNSIKTSAFILLLRSIILPTWGYEIIQPNIYVTSQNRAVLFKLYELPFPSSMHKHAKTTPMALHTTGGIYSYFVYRALFNEQNGEQLAYPSLGELMCMRVELIKRKRRKNSINGKDWIGFNDIAKVSNWRIVGMEISCFTAI